jgi:hypothetical protein
MESQTTKEGRKRRERRDSAPELRFIDFLDGD